MLASWGDRRTRASSGHCLRCVCSQRVAGASVSSISMEDIAVLLKEADGVLEQDGSDVDAEGDAGSKMQSCLKGKDGVFYFGDPQKINELRAVKEY